ncbi:MAG: VWA domain-containing protein [bacterium]|nr:VWA domain-containing protein [bacterium]MDE0602225.1 VWA domain-containing protein [bacterium]
MRFGAPELIWLAPLGVAGIWYMARRGRWTVGRRRRRWVLALRMVGVGLALLALAQPVLSLPQRQRAVLLTLDRSLSMGSESRSHQEQLVAQALPHAGTDDLVGLMVFGSEARMDTALTTGRELLPVRSVVDGSASELDSALRAAAALLPTAGARRVVLMSDMAATGGGVREVIEELAEAGVAVDVVVLESALDAEALVEWVEVPGLVREGELLSATVRVRSSYAGPAQLRITAGDHVELREVRLQVGASDVEVLVPIDEALAPIGEEDGKGGGPLAVEARLFADWDEYPENNRAVGITRVEGPAKVAVVEDRTRRGEGAFLQAALEASGLTVERLVGIPPAENLAEYDGVVLVNVNVGEAAEAENLVSYVEDFGRGLVVVGGDRSFGVGDYHQTPLESVLPVSSDPDDLLRRQPVAEVLALDTSGSMGSCHCGGNAERIAGGTPKTAIAQAGASQAIDALTSSDQVGVLAFSSGFDWTIPLGPRPGTDEVAAALSTLTPEGDTEIAPALAEALRVLEGVEGSLRHIVLFTDGWDPNESGLLPLARQISEEGVTLSILGTGEGPGPTLERMAELGGGRYYPGADLDLVPEIFVEETLLVAENLVREGFFYPVRTGSSPISQILAEAPPLRGYVATKAKGTATVSLEVGAEHPLLASWQRGLGRVSVWTSDATSRWGLEWVSWDGFVQFWGTVVRDTLSVQGDGVISATVEGGRLSIGLDLPGLPTEVTGVARIRGPDGEVDVISLRRVASARFEAQAPADAAGAYWITAEIHTPDGGMTFASAGAVSTYQEEFSFLPPDPTLAQEIAEVTGGRVDPAPDSFFDAVSSRGVNDLAIWPWLAGLALALFLADVAARRLRFSAGGAVTAQTVGRPPEDEPAVVVDEPLHQPDSFPPPEPERTESLERLMRRRRR